jgi:Zn-finger nucleic acid-binding protein
MDRRQFAKVSRVIVDVCKDHGIWLDHDELPRIVRFVADGGLQAARKEALERQVDNLLNTHRSSTIKSPASRPYKFGATYGNPLLDIVAGLLAALFR